MGTIKIKEASARKAYNNASKESKTLLEDLLGKEIFNSKITDRIKGFDDILNELGVEKSCFDENCKGLESDEVAYRKAKLVCQALNEGWIPDWSNSNEYKYVPWFKMGSSSGVGFAYYGFGFWAASSDVGSRLCFKSSELAEFAGKLFEQEIYKPLFTI